MIFVFFRPLRGHLSIVPDYTRPCPVLSPPRRRRAVRRDWKKHVKRRAAPWFAVHRNRPAALLHNSIDRREPQSGALSLLLGGEERFKNAGLDFRRHAAAVVAHRQPDILPGQDFDQ